MRLPPAPNTGLSLATIAAAQIVSSLPIARASHPTSDLSDEMWVGVEPGAECSAMIDAPVPCLFDLALKLQTTKSPAVKAPVVTGAIERP